MRVESSQVGLEPLHESTDSSLSLSGETKVPYDAGISPDTKVPSAFLDTPALRTVRNKCLPLQVTQPVVFRATVAGRLGHQVKRGRVGVKGAERRAERGTHARPPGGCHRVASETAAREPGQLEHQG